MNTRDGHHESTHGDPGHGHEDHDQDHGTSVMSRVRHAVTPHSHDATEAIQSAEEAGAEGIRAAWIGLGGMAATAVAQLVIVAVSGSIALMADTLHNVGHAVTTIPLIIAFRIGQRAASKRFGYGYGRAEDLVGVFISLIIGVSAGLIIWESVNAVIDPRPLTNLWWVFAAGLVGAAGNEIVAVYRIRIGRRIGSAALIAEGQHARADGFTSIAVAVGVVGVWAGFPLADAIIGFVIALVILGILVSSLRTTVRRLMDGVDPGLVETIDEIAAQVPGVTRVERARARWVGHRLVADATIAVDPTLSVAEAHQISEHAEHELLHRVSHLESIVVHLHPAVGNDELERLHELTAHHASREAREAYLARH